MCATGGPKNSKRSDLKIGQILENFAMSSALLGSHSRTNKIRYWPYSYEIQYLRKVSRDFLL